MGWIILIIVIALLATVLDSGLGKLTIGVGVVAIGMLLLNWILDVGIFVILAKLCAVVIVLLILWAVLAAIFGG